MVFMARTKANYVLQLVRKRGLLQASDLEAKGLPRRYLPRLEQRGELERVARGLYALPDRGITEHHDLAVAAKAVPEGVLPAFGAPVSRPDDTGSLRSVDGAGGGKLEAERGYRPASHRVHVRGVVWRWRRGA